MSALTTVPTTTRSAVVIRPLVRVVVILHTVLLFAQPVLAGMALEDVSGALDLHMMNGDVVLALAVVHIVVAVLWWKPAGGAWWPAVLALCIYGAEVVQVNVGNEGVFAVHLPLGVSVVVASLVMLFAVFSRRGLRMAVRNTPRA